MRPGQNKRMRGRPNNNRRGPNPLTRSYESNGPDVKIRGNAHHVAEKYLQLARDAHTSSDPVAAENYLQHAEHYFRLIASAQAAQLQQQNGSARPPGEGDADEMDDDDDVGGLSDRFASPAERRAAALPAAARLHRRPSRSRSRRASPIRTGRPTRTIGSRRATAAIRGARTVRTIVRTDRGPRDNRPYQDRQDQQRDNRDNRDSRDNRFPARQPAARISPLSRSQSAARNRQSARGGGARAGAAFVHHRAAARQCRRRMSRRRSSRVADQPPADRGGGAARRCGAVRQWRRRAAVSRARSSASAASELRLQCARGQPAADSPEQPPHKDEAPAGD